MRHPLIAIISFLSVVIAVLAVVIPGSAISGPDLTVDGVAYEPTKIVGQAYDATVHYETPDTNPTVAFTDRHQWVGNGSELLPCQYGIHWIDNKNVLTISHCLEDPDEETTTSTTQATTTSTPTSSSTSSSSTSSTSSSTTSSTTSTSTSTTTTVPETTTSSSTTTSTTEGTTTTTSGTTSTTTTTEPPSTTTSSTTTVPESTTTTDTSTTTTTDPCIDSNGDGVKTPDTDGDGVEDDPEAPSCELPFTGVDVAPFALLGSALLAAGALLLLAVRSSSQDGSR